MEFIDLYIILFFGGGILIVNGIRKRQRKDLFLHGSISWILIAFLSLLPLLYNLERRMEFPMRTVDMVFIGVVIVGFIITMITRFRQEMTQKKMNIHNMTTDEVEKIIQEGLEKYNVDYKYEKAAGKRGIFNFPDSKAEIEVHSHYITAEHQRVTFSKTNQIPRFEDIFDGLNEESEKRERPISKSLGLLDIAFGSSLLILGVYVMQLFS